MTPCSLEVSLREEVYMYRRWLAYAGILALVLAVVMMTAAPASAQRFGGFGVGAGRGNYGSGFGYGGLGSGYNSFGYSPYSTGYYGNGFNNTWGGWGNNYSSGYNPGWSNWGYGTNYNSFGYTPNYYSSGWGSQWHNSPGTTYYGTQPNAYTGNTFYGTNALPSQNYTSFYSADHGFDMSKVPANAALFHVHVPPDAKVSFSGHETTEMGQHRQFVTPALEENQTYSYDIKAQWNDNGQNVQQSRKVLVHPGDRIRLDFNRDMTVVEQVTPSRNRSQSGYEGGTDQRNRSNEVIPAPAEKNDLNRNDLNRNNLNRNDLNRTDVPRTTDDLNRPSGTVAPTSNQGATPTPRGTPTTNPSTPK